MKQSVLSYVSILMDQCNSLILSYYDVKQLTIGYKGIDLHFCTTNDLFLKSHTCTCWLFLDSMMINTIVRLVFPQNISLGCALHKIITLTRGLANFKLTLSKKQLDNQVKIKNLCHPTECDKSSLLAYCNIWSIQWCTAVMY